MAFVFKKYSEGGGGSGIIDVTELPTEGIDENAVYRVTEETTLQIYLVVEGIKITFQEFFEMQGDSATVPTYVVDELPSTMEPIDGATVTIPVYILSETGIAYVSEDGTSATATPLGAFFFGGEGLDKGWTDDIDSIDETSMGNMGFWCTRAGTVVTLYMYNAEKNEFEEYPPKVITLKETVEGLKAENAELTTAVENNETALEGIVARDLTTFTIPDGTEEIGYSAFAECNNLESVSIPDSVKRIRRDAFYGAGITSIEIPSSVTTIDPEAFNYCAKLTSLVIPETVQNSNLAGDKSFQFCSSMTSIVLPSCVSRIGVRSFEGCEALTNIEIPDNVTIINDYAFSNCSALESVSFGANSQLTTIGISAFDRCKSLASITIPNGVTSIGSSAFYECEKLATVVLPETITTINQSAFVFCYALNNVVIPEGVTTIGASAFSKCTSLSNITIPSSVTQIGPYALNRCTSLTNITFTGTKEQWKAIVTLNEWNTETGDYTITCTDGTIAKDGTET